jgi:hypothetical protein
MGYQFTIQFNEQHIKYASHKFFFKRFSNSIMSASFIAVLIILLFVMKRHVDWLTWLGLGVLLVSSTSLISFYFRSTQRRLARLKKQGGTIDYELSEDFLKTKTSSASAEIKWDTFKAIWIFPKVWLLLARDGGYLTFPLDQISLEIREFLKRKISSVGGLIE